MHIIAINDGAATLTLDKMAAGVYQVLGCSLATDTHEFVFDPKESAPDVVNLDTFSDYASCFDLSVHVQVGECDICRESMKAKNLQVLKAALRKVRFTSIHPDEL